MSENFNYNRTTQTTTTAGRKRTRSADDVNYRPTGYYGTTCYTHNGRTQLPIMPNNNNSKENENKTERTTKSFVSIAMKICLVLVFGINGVSILILLGMADILRPWIGEWEDIFEHIPSGEKWSNVISLLFWPFGIFWYVFLSVWALLGMILDVVASLVEDPINALFGWHPLYRFFVRLYKERTENRESSTVQEQR